MPNFSRVLHVLTAATSLTVVACGGSSTVSPAAPSALGSAPAPSPNSPAPAPASTTGAVISGRVTGSALTSALSASTFDARLAATDSGAITVTVAGTNTSTTVAQSGDFTLTGVPSGSVQLLFSGRGASATLTLTGVEPTHRIQISVTLDRTNAEVETENREQPGTSRVEVNGRITAVSTTGFSVGTTVVTVPAGATIRHGSTDYTLADLSVGDKVEVKGTRTATGVTATEVKVQSAGNPNSTIGNGSSNSGQGSANSGKGNNGSNGNSGKGNNGNSGKGGKDDDEDDEDEDEDEDEVSGSVASLGTGACPNLTFVIAGVTVKTSASTKFDDIACSAIKVGTKLEVKGTKTGTTLTATKVEKD